MAFGGTGAQKPNAILHSTYEERATLSLSMAHVKLFSNGWPPPRVGLTNQGTKFHSSQREPDEGEGKGPIIGEE